jgi:adenine phosphoribosyltransferase
MEDDLAWLKELVRDVPDFPRPGVMFKDITPLWSDSRGLTGSVDALADAYRDRGIDKVIGIEARGFIIAAPVALRLGAGFVPVRKVGKLPSRAHSETYDLEYGTDTLEMHVDALSSSDTVLIVDDVLATGGTAAAAHRLADRSGARVAGFGFVIELAFLSGRAKLADIDTVSLITYD